MWNTREGVNTSRITVYKMVNLREKLSASKTPKTLIVQNNYVAKSYQNNLDRVLDEINVREVLNSNRYYKKDTKPKNPIHVGTFIKDELRK